jgi:hypothetical protein
MANPRQQRLRAVSASTGGRRYIGLLEAFEWVNANRSNFRGPVYGPAFLEMEVKQPSANNGGPPQAGNLWAMYLEKQCGSHLFNFVTSCRHVIAEPGTLLACARSC